MPCASSTGRRPTSSTRSPARSPARAAGLPPITSASRRPLRRPYRSATTAGTGAGRPDHPQVGAAHAAVGSSVATIRRVVVFIGTASPSPTPATAVLIPTTGPRRVGERAAGVAGVERGVGLDHVLDHPPGRAAAGRQRPAERADDARGHRARQPERVADRDDELADDEPVGVAERHRRRQRPETGAQHGEVRQRVGADDGSPSTCAPSTKSARPRRACPTTCAFVMRIPSPVTTRRPAAAPRPHRRDLAGELGRHRADRPRVGIQLVHGNLP